MSAGCPRRGGALFPRSEADLTPEQLAWLKAQPAEVRIQFWRTPLGVLYRIKATGALAIIYSYCLPDDGGPLTLTLETWTPSGVAMRIRDVPPDAIAYWREAHEPPPAHVVRDN